MPIKSWTAYDQWPIERQVAVPQPFDFKGGVPPLSKQIESRAGKNKQTYPVGTWFTLCCLVLVFIWPGALHGQIQPSSRRSQQAVGRQRPLLEKDMAAKGFVWGQPMFMRIFKAEQQLEIWIKQGNHFERYKTYPICTYGEKGLGPKTREGDGRAPEGFYYVTPGHINPNSRFHLAFNLGYPNAYDRFHGYTGSALMVHGGCVSIGCFAMTDRYMEEIYTQVDAAFKNGQPFIRVHIFPFIMNKKNMQASGNSRWIHFWRNLKVGYDWFADQGNVPPNVVVDQGRYFFEKNPEFK